MRKKNRIGNRLNELTQILYTTVQTALNFVLIRVNIYIIAIKNVGKIFNNSDIFIWILILFVVL